MEAAATPATFRGMFRSVPIYRSIQRPCRPMSAIVW